MTLQCYKCGHGELYGFGGGYYCKACREEVSDSQTSVNIMRERAIRAETERDEARCAAAVAAEQRDSAEGSAERLEEELAAVRSEVVTAQHLAYGAGDHHMPWSTELICFRFQRIIEMIDRTTPTAWENFSARKAIKGVKP